MAELNRTPGVAADAASHRQHHQRSKSSVLRSLIGGGHKRNNSDGLALPPSDLCTPIGLTPGFHASERNLAVNSNDVFYVGFDTSAAAAMERQRNPRPLGELPQNQPDRSPERSPERWLGRGRSTEVAPSPAKTGGFATISLRPFTRDSSKPRKSKDEDTSSSKPKKSKSATNLAALLRPKSMKNLKQLLTDDDGLKRTAKDKDKENRTPHSSLGSDHVIGTAPATPIYAQFASNAFGPPSPQVEFPLEPPVRNSSERFGVLSSWRKPRPKSFQAYTSNREDGSTRSAESGGDSGAKRQTWGKGSDSPASGPPARSRPKLSAAAGGPEVPTIDPKDIDKHLEALLDRRNIPENQRYKMRNLSDTIKMEFIRQDWAETQAQLERPGSDSGSAPPPGTSETAADSMADRGDSSGRAKKEKKHGRGLSLTIVKGGSKGDAQSPIKKRKGDSNLGRHFRTKSSESLVSEPPSPGPFSGYGSNLLAKVKGQQLPGDFVAYLRKVQQPELVEVGKLHKLRLLLRNETVAWTEEFIRSGGMKEIVELLHRIMAVEWREEHEDALLHENLLCLKALCTTAMALQYLHSIHSTLFPALLHMIFDPEKKGPSEFTTRTIITSILLTYIEAATPQERVSRARAVLGYLRDPEPKEEERPLDFVLEMRRERPYRVWCKEVVNVTKEVFWIFLHHLNVIALPSATDKSPTTCDDKTGAEATSTTTTSMSATGASGGDDASRPGANRGSSVATTQDPDCQQQQHQQYAYMARHFPQKRPPVPAAPYVGGVEWDATNYLASHLDLMNAILACTGPTSRERNALRAELRISGWERCLGGSLRLCKEKFYGAVHDGLRTWVAAAAEDGWDVRDVRYGPPPDTRSRSVSPAKRAPAGGAGGGGGNGGNNKKKQDPAPPPRIEMPKLDFAVEGGDMLADVRSNDAWLS